VGPREGPDAVTNRKISASAGHPVRGESIYTFKNGSPTSQLMVEVR